MGERARTDLKPLPFSGGVDSEVEPNEYDKVRKVVPFRESRSLNIGARTLSTEMSCPICLDLLSQTMTAKECLHRFCSECITMALQRGNKECPTCRKKLVSKRSLRPDPSFDLLISKVWPDRSIYDNLQTHELEFGREESPEDESPGEPAEDGVSQPKKKKTGSYDPESLMEYFLAQQSRRQKAEEEEFPELNGEQAFLEREAIDNLLDNGSMQEYDEFNEDDDVYGDELDLDESGNVIESAHRHTNNNRETTDETLPDDNAGPADYDPYAYSEDNEEGEFDDYDTTIDGMSALTPEQQEELQADLDELEAVEYEDYELDFSDEEVEEENDLLLGSTEENNGIRCQSDSEESSGYDGVGTEEPSKETTPTSNGGEEGTSDSSVSSPLTPEAKPLENGGNEEEIDRDATPPAYAPDMEIETQQQNASLLQAPGNASEEEKPEAGASEPPPPPHATTIHISPTSQPTKLVPQEGPFSSDGAGNEKLEFTPPRDDEEEPSPCSINSIMATPMVSIGGPAEPSTQTVETIGPMAGGGSILGGSSVIAIAPSFEGRDGVIVKKERNSPSPQNPISNDAIVVEEEDDNSSDSTSTTYSSSGCTTSLSSDSSIISMTFSPDEDAEPVNNNNLKMEQMFITEGDIQLPSSSSHLFFNSPLKSDGSASVKPAATSLTVFSEDLPPHREIDPSALVELSESGDEVRPPSSTIPSTDRLTHWLANSPSSPQSVDEDMAEMPTRRADDCDMLEPVSGSEEIEAELLPASSLMQRDCPDELLIPRYVRAKHDTKMEHLAEFIHQRAMEEFQSNQTDFDANSVPNIPKPKHFYVFSRNGGHHVKQIFLHETMATALCAMTQGDHLIIFYDVAGIDLRGEKLSLLADVVPSHFLNLPTV